MICNPLFGESQPQSPKLTVSYDMGLFTSGIHAKLEAQRGLWSYGLFAAYLGSVNSDNVQGLKSIHDFRVVPLGLLGLNFDILKRVHGSGMLVLGAEYTLLEERIDDVIHDIHSSYETSEWIFERGFIISLNIDVWWKMAVTPHFLYLYPDPRKSLVGIGITFPLK